MKRLLPRMKRLVPRMEQFLVTGLVAAAVAARADDRLWILTGEAYKDNYYLGGGLLIPFPRSHLGQGWVQRYWLDTFTYTYEAGPQQIDSSVWGAEAMLGYQASRPGLSGAVYLGVRYSDAHLSPDDPGSALARPAMVSESAGRRGCDALAELAGQRNRRVHVHPGRLLDPAARGPWPDRIQIPRTGGGRCRAIRTIRRSSWARCSAGSRCRRACHST